MKTESVPIDMQLGVWGYAVTGVWDDQAFVCETGYDVLPSGRRWWDHDVAWLVTGSIWYGAEQRPCPWWWALATAPEIVLAEVDWATLLGPLDG